MKPTPLTDTHIALGAKMAEFAGFNMPISYSSITDEHFAVRNSVGVFDVSHMGEFIVKGREALQLVQKVTSNDASKLNPGDVQYSCMPNHDGGIVDDLLVYRLFDDQCSEGEQAFMLVVNASNMGKDWAWISAHNVYDTRLINISDQAGLIAVQGPKAIDALQSLTDVDLSAIEYYHFTKGTVAGISNVLISATGYTGSGGFEFYVDDKDTKALWDAIMAAGKAYDIKPCGLGARDTLRLEMGYCLYGNDIDDTTSPLEAGLGWNTKLKKSKDFNGRDWLLAQKDNGLHRKLVAFALNERRVPRHGYALYDVNDKEIGVVTSGTQSPSLDKPIGMGYVTIDNAVLGNTIKVGIGSKFLDATIVELPFVEIKK